MKKKFIITIDTEGDNLWGWKEGMPLTTENVLSIPRFQNLCERYQFIPTWLCNWEMVNDERFVDYMKEKLAEGKCSIGMHLHAWNNPPYYALPRHEKARLPYLVEYPRDVMKKKLISMTDLIEEKFGKRPTVHRAGRWAMNDEYFEILAELGYIADCSITPGVNWKKNYGQTPGFEGPDYYNERVQISNRKRILEIPVTTLWSAEKERTFWLRPQKNNMDEMLYLIEQYKNSEIEYLMFMLHSSELKAGTNPTFLTEEDIEKLYQELEELFLVISRDYVGIGLEEYANELIVKKFIDGE